MTAVILAAGHPGRDFPADSKPKCLYHYRGRVLLDIAFDSVNQVGIEQTRIVVGWKSEAIQQHVLRRRWNVEVVFNPTWETDSVSSLEAGMWGIDDDLLITCADLIVDRGIITAFLHTDPLRLSWVRSLLPWDASRGNIVYDDLYRNDIDNSILKIPRSMLGIFENSRARAEAFLARYHWGTPTGPGTGVYLGAAITETFNQYRPIEEVVIERPICDIDFYSQTDEARLHHLVRFARALETR